jgi:hypothetical protein
MRQQLRVSPDVSPSEDFSLRAQVTSVSSEDAISRAKNSYDSSDADNFYSMVWGGDDIHIGIYQSLEESIATASRRTVIEMVSRISGRTQGDTLSVLDIGAGYGGCSIFI